MNKIILFCFIFQLSCSGKESSKYGVEPIQNTSSSISSDICAKFNALNIKIRDGLILKQDALKEIEALLPTVKNYYYKNDGHNFEKNSWIFPVQGYNIKSIGGIEGNGFLISGYNFFDGNKHKGHPAHDIFISDRNQDCIDDNTMKSVYILSMTGGVVISTESEWDTVSDLRGGKYIWIYDPNTSSLFYYGHNDRISVRLGDILIPGDTIGTVGRTGLNAFKKRSPTHLHLMQLQLDSNYYPRPVDFYNDLKGIRSDLR